MDTRREILGDGGASGPCYKPPMPNRAAAGTPLSSQRLANAYYAVGLTVLIAITLYFGRIVLVPLALSALLAFILSVPAEWVEKRGLGRVAGVLIVTLAAFGLIGAVIALAAGELRELAAEMPSHRPVIEAKLKPIENLMHRLEAIQSKLNRAAPASQPTTTQPIAGERPVPVVVAPPHESSLAWLPALALPLVESLIHSVLIVVLTIFLLMQRENFRDRLIRLAGRSRLSATTRTLDDAAKRVGQYLLLQLAINASLGLVIGIGLWLAGVPYASLWGLLVMLLRFVPYVGFWIAAAGAILIAAATSPGWTTAIVAGVMFLVADLVMANVIEPLVFSHGTGVSPVALLMAAVFWAFIWGPVGLLLSTPLTVCLAVLGKNVPALGFLAVLLGDEASLEAAARFYNRLLARDYDAAAVLVDEAMRDKKRDEIYDTVLLPALAEAKTDREENDITVEEEAAVYDAAASVLDNLEADAEPVKSQSDSPVKVTGCAVFGRADELALRMLGDAIRPAGGELSVVTPDTIDAELQKAIDAAGGKPVVACFSTLSPGGLTQARAILQRVRAKFPNVKLLVGRWGQRGDTSQTEKFLRDSGAAGIGWSLRDTVRQLVPGKGT
jgi:predicted PurR-regulated permease PerM